MTKIDDGGPAFPNVNSDERVGIYVGDAGMSLRDFFAAQAMSICAPKNDCTPKDSEDYELIAGRAYGLADAMIKERAKRPASDPVE